MPIGTITTYKGALSNEQKQELHREFTDMMVRIEGNGNEELRKYVILNIKEVEHSQLSWGGRCPTKKLLDHLTTK
jgi:phenylpyruvate tautomerase PptA (4-oxalocrotonate tautomerase family)